MIKKFNKIFSFALLKRISFINWNGHFYNFSNQKNLVLSQVDDQNIFKSKLNDLKCSGCGIPIQISDPSKLGYIS